MLAALLAVMSCFLTGCSLFKKKHVEFTESSIVMNVGDIRNLSDIIDANTSRYSLSVSNTNVVKLSGKTLTAVGTGVATVTAKAGASASTLGVTVAEDEEDTLALETQGELAQAYGETSEVVFTPVATGISAAGSLEWYVNDELRSTAAGSKTFAFTPTEQGAFKVKVQSSTLSAEETVRVYKPADITVSASGVLYQTVSPYSAIDFEASVSAVDGNPDAYCEWFVDDVSVQAGVELKFQYVPTAGTHTVKVKVNGAFVDIDSEPSITVTCEGSITPEGAPKIVYDNVYPHVYVTYDVKGSACVEISSPDGTVTEYSQNAPEYAEYFDENGFDAGEFVTLCSTSSTQKAYRIRVKSLGDGGALKESEYSPVGIMTMLPSYAEQYLLKRYLDSDYYITSPEEYADLFEYKSVFRSKNATSSGVSVSFDCYMAYRVSDPKKLFYDAFHIGATSGSYGSIVCDYTYQNVLRTSYTVDTVNKPTRQAKTYYNDSMYSTQLHTIIPHINYDTSKYRASNYVFPIDRLENTETVTYSDELYLAAENNTRPVPTRGSNAETVYGLARDVLRKIVTDDMTDRQKAHAIYDWVMWQVTYDSVASEKTVNGESYSAYYLEGVFGDGSTSIGGVKYYPYSVCDGMSKAYSLLCNMEGIPCVRVSGEAGTSGDLGGHAWNKVYIDGAWYIVDCTWGDGQAKLAFGSSVSEIYELGLHDWLFVSDAEASESHFEPHDLGKSQIVYAPRTAKTSRRVYSDMTFNGVTVDCLIGGGENQAERVCEIVKEFASAFTTKTSITVPGGPNGGVYQVTYQAVEIYFDCDVTLSDSKIAAEIETALEESGRSFRYRNFMYGNILLVLLRLD